jgi:Spy/CpxP family protein refolding chaperone
MNEPGRSPRLIGAALLLAAFVAGAAVGFAFDRVVRREPQLKTFVVADMSRVLDRLELTTQQRAQADSILLRRAPTTERMMLDVADRLRGLSDSVDAELRAILTPQQRVRLDSLRGERKLMLKRKTIGAGGATVVDTVFSQRDSVRR